MSSRKFDIQKELAVCTDFKLGYLAGFALPDGAPSGLVASAQAQDFVYCALVGLLPRLADQIPGRVAWLDRALEHSAFPAERSAFQRAEMFKAKAVYLWLLGQHGSLQRVWQDARQAHELAMREPGHYQPRDLATLALDDHLALCLLAQEFGEGVQCYERLRPGPAPVLARALAPRDWGYLACRNEISPDARPEALLKAGQRMLKRWMDDPWLGRGQALRAAMWLLAVHDRHGQQLPPAQLLAKAIDALQ